MRRYGLGAIFAIGWTPCVGVILGAILGLAAGSQTVAQGGILLIVYTLGLGLPFLAIALVYERAPALMRPLVRHGHAVSVIGGALVVAVGIAMVMDWLVHHVDLVRLRGHLSERSRRFTHRKERHGLVGPFSGRQLAVAAISVVVAAVGLFVATRPLGSTGPISPADPRATPYILGPAPSEGLRLGELAPEFTVSAETARPTS